MIGGIDKEDDLIGSAVGAEAELYRVLCSEYSTEYGVLRSQLLVQC